MRSLIDQNGTLNFCSCQAASDPAALQTLANRLGRQVCACDGDVYAPM